MKKWIFLIFASLATPGFAALGETPAMLADGMARLGSLEVSMLDGGFYRDKEGLLYPGARFVFKYVGAEKRFHRNITVELLDDAGQKLVSWKTFLSLKPGKSLERRYGRDSLAKWARLEEAPKLAMRVSYKGGSSELFSLPAIEQHFGLLPSEKAEIRAMTAIDGDTLALPDGQRVRLIGINSPELVAEDPSRTEYGVEAHGFSASALARGPVKLSYEGKQRDAYGRILSYVWLADGQMLNRELLISGYAQVDERSDFALKGEFLKLQTDARKARKGLWEPRN